MDIAKNKQRVLEVIEAEGGIGRPGWGPGLMVDRDPYTSEVWVEFWRERRSFVRMRMDRNELWKLTGPLLDRFIKAHLEIVRVYAEAMDQ